MSEFGAALKPISEKIGAFFQVFDLSFFLSGGVCLLAGTVYYAHQDWWTPEVGSKTAVAAGVLLSYVLGQLCLALGRGIRRGSRTRWKRKESRTRIVEMMTRNGLRELPEYRGFFIDTGRTLLTEYAAVDLYARLWTDLRHDKKATASFELLHSYWMRGAIFDGVVGSGVVWFVVVVSLGCQSGGWWLWGTAAIFVFLAIILAIYEAGRLEDRQIEDLVAVLGSTHYQRANIQGPFLSLQVPDILHAELSQEARRVAPDIVSGWAQATLKAESCPNEIQDDIMASFDPPWALTTAAALAAYRGLERRLATSDAPATDIWREKPAFALAELRQVLESLTEGAQADAQVYLAQDPAVGHGRLRLLSVLDNSLKELAPTPKQEVQSPPESTSHAQPTSTDMGEPLRDRRSSRD